MITHLVTHLGMLSLRWPCDNYEALIKKHEEQNSGRFRLEYQCPYIKVEHDTMKVNKMTLEESGEQ